MKYSKEEHISCRDCGGCKHWKEWDDKRKQQEVLKYEQLGLRYTFTALAQGDCSKIPKGQEWKDKDGSTYAYDGTSFEDECYDEVMHCFEPEPE